MMPFVHGAYAAGKLSCGFWDHWVPSANVPPVQLARLERRTQENPRVMSNRVDRRGRLSNVNVSFTTGSDHVDEGLLETDQGV
jgi:hypothetical protein